jgi:basic membrane lipoprotein Med (substrate-binding protein (PBP1-ABC) superfamily)
LDRQIKSTKSISQNIGSDLRLVTPMLQDLADSIYLESEMLSGDKVGKILDEKFNQLNSVTRVAVTRVDSALITDKEDIITTYKASQGLETFVNIDISFNEYMKETKKSLQPVYSDADIKFIVFTGLVKSKNVASIFPRQQEATYLLGALASMLSKNHTIGFIGRNKKITVPE